MIIIIASTKKELDVLPLQAIGAADIVMCGGKAIKSRYWSV